MLRQPWLATGSFRSECCSASTCSGLARKAVDSQQHPPPSTALQYKKRAQDVIRNRKYFATSCGVGYPCDDSTEKEGLCPDQTEEGDAVCILYGCSVPVILRNVNGNYKLIGECFLFGMMDGEALSVERFTSQAQQFEIY